MSEEPKTDLGTSLVQVIPEVIAVPSAHPGGLTAKLGAHFGRCECFTIVRYAEDDTQVEVIENGPHGSCTSVIEMLKQHKVEAIAARHMGLKPLQACTSAGIVPFAVAASTVAEACELLRNGKLKIMEELDSCHGSSKQSRHREHHRHRRQDG